MLDCGSVGEGRTRVNSPVCSLLEVAVDASRIFLAVRQKCQSSKPPKIA
jgi:hypothetical protein